MHQVRTTGLHIGLSLALVLIAWTAGFTASRAAGAHLHPCNQIKVARCGALTVFENRAASRGRKIQIAVTTIPASGPKRHEPIFLLEGGPGQSATEVAPAIVHSPDAKDFLRDHDIVLVDQRGTGLSNPLQCPPPKTPQGYFGHVEYDPEGLKACRTKLERKADLTLYTSSIGADDLDEVRAWLGYDKIVLWGTSYGTKAAMVYMRRHPVHVGAAILDGVDSFGSKDPLFYAYGSQKGLERVFADCAAHPACAKAFPRLQQSFAKLLDSFRRGPRAAHIRTSPKGPLVGVRYSLGDFGYTVRGLLYSPERTALLPSQIAASLASGNVDAFAQAYYDRAHDFGQALAGGLYLSITCAEGLTQYNPDEVLRWTAGTFLGDYLIQDYRRACALWRRAKVPAGYFRPLESDIPTLLFSGGRDPTTPADVAEGVARHLSRARHVVFPQGGHGNADNPCGLSVVKAFLRTKSVRDLDTSCANAVSSKLPFVLPKRR